MKIIFILVNPCYPENVGSVARAIKTMGFNELRLVKPCDHLCDNARWLAHGSFEILQNAKVYENFEEATHDIDFTIGTTAKKRVISHDYHDMDALPKLLKDKENAINKAAMVFGSEDYGLPNEIVNQCDIISSIPLATTHPSLNLAQSVMLYAYTLSKINLPAKEVKNSPTTPESYQNLKSKLKEILHLLEFEKDTNIYNRIFERFGLVTSEDINLLHSISHILLKKLK